MAKKKHRLRNLHKIKIYHNRWLIWAIAYVVIFATAMIGYLKVSDINFETQQIADTQFQPWHSYKNTYLGFSQRYPADWWLEVQDQSSIVFVPSGSDQGVTVRVVKPSAETAIRKTLKISNESRTLLDNNPAAKLTNDLGDSHFETVILSIHNHRLYVLRGSQSLVQKLLLTFNFE